MWTSGSSTQESPLSLDPEFDQIAQAQEPLSERAVLGAAGAADLRVF